MRELAEGVRLLGPDNYRRMRWKNGGGWTTEIAVYPPGAGLSGKPFDWRISLAEIEQDGEFSAFPGYDRTILMAEGAGMELSFDAAPTQTFSEPYRPLRFKGEWHTHCRLLHGPVWDFNVMSKRAAWQHRCDIMLDTPVTSFATPPVPQAIIVYCFRGKARARIGKQPDMEFQSGETLYFSATQIQQPRQITLSGTGAAMAVASLLRLQK